MEKRAADRRASRDVLVAAKERERERERGTIGEPAGAKLGGGGCAFGVDRRVDRRELSANGWCGLEFKGQEESRVSRWVEVSVGCYSHCKRSRRQHPQVIANQVSGRRPPSEKRGYPNYAHL